MAALISAISAALNATKSNMMVSYCRC
jgi:hypothetical protein